MRVFADLWDVERFFSCECSPARAARLAAINREQHVIDRVACMCNVVSGFSRTARGICHNGAGRG